MNIIHKDKTDYYILTMSDDGEITEVTHYDDFKLEEEEKKTINPWFYRNYSTGNPMLTIDHTSRSIYSFEYNQKKWKKEIVFDDEF